MHRVVRQTSDSDRYFPQNRPEVYGFLASLIPRVPQKRFTRGYLLAARVGAHSRV